MDPPFHPDPDALLDLAQNESITTFGVSAKYLSAIEKAGRQATPNPRPRRLAGGSFHRLAPHPRRLPIRLPRVQGRRRAAIDFRRHRPDFVLRPRLSLAPGSRGRVAGQGTWHGGRRIRRSRTIDVSGVGAERGIGVYAFLPECAHWILERSRGCEVPGSVFRQARRRLGTRRLRRGHRERRHDHPRSFRRRTQPRRRTHRHGRDLPPGGDYRGSPRLPRDRTGLGRRHANRAFRRHA